MFSFKKKLDNQSIFSGNIPSVGEKEDPIDKEQAAEEERLRQEAIKEAEEKRRVKHKKMEEDRENMRQGIRDRVRCFHNFAEKREHALVDGNRTWPPQKILHDSGKQIRIPEGTDSTKINRPGHNICMY